MSMLELSLHTVLTCTWILIISGNVIHTKNTVDDWWTNNILYQVYPRSFKDSDNDGIGDLKGIAQKLDHFVDLGVDILWVGSIFKSPIEDMGHDVEDYKMIDPVLGTMDDFEKLILETNKRNLKLVIDFVPNHSSHKCEWFQKSIQRIGNFTDYYIWKDAINQNAAIRDLTDKPIPPNNWLSVFGGSAWTWNADRKQFFYHQFSSKQPDFNIRNPNVQKEIFDILEFWMDKGVAGFRFGSLKHLYESTSMENEPYVPGKTNSKNFNDMIHKYTIDQPENLKIVYAWREFLDNYTIRHHSSSSIILMTTDSYSSNSVLKQYYGNSTKLGAQIPINFYLFDNDQNSVIKSIDESILMWLNATSKNMTTNWEMENNDNIRVPTKFGAQMVQVLTALKLILPGVDVTYYGSEIGMENIIVNKDQIQDPNYAGGLGADESRYDQRTPMQWDDSVNAGFTNASTPWLPVHPKYNQINVETQKNIPTSNYNFFKSMSLLRKTNTLKYGNLLTYNVNQSIYIIQRSLPNYESYFVAINFGSEKKTISLFNVINNITENVYVYLGSENSAYNKGSIVSTKPNTENVLILRPLSVVVLTDKILPVSSSSGSSKTNQVIFAIIFICTIFVLNL